MTRIPCLKVPLVLAILAFCGNVEPVRAESGKDGGDYDVVIYGGTSAAVTAAVQVRKMGKSVVIVSPDRHLGGLTSGGLGWTDTGNKDAIGGLSWDFYHRVWKYYQSPEAWTWQTKAEFGSKKNSSPATESRPAAMWVFEPHVAEAIFDQLVQEHQIPVYRDEWLDRDQGVTREGARITSIKTLSGKTFRGKVFLDTTYEGDLMAAADVSYTVGRESAKTYGEKWAGVQTGVLHHGHHFGKLSVPISPYLNPQDPASGLLPHVSAEPPGDYGSGDRRVQAYCFRMCLTNVPANRVPFPKPEGYDPQEYELLGRVLDAGWRDVFRKFDTLPNHKTDTNNHGPFSTDYLGANYDYPDASYERRREIIHEHERYQKGLMYFLANDSRVPDNIRSSLGKWGLPRDEFQDNGNWPHQLYIREARRMVGERVMTEHELLKTKPVLEPVGMGSYSIDSHNVQRYITPEGFVQNEGDLGVSTRGPYQIEWKALLPKKAECTNLIVPVCASTSHIAYGSIRMEPVFMILGQSAATGAVQAIDAGLPLQDLPYEPLRQQLLKDGQVLELSRTEE